MLCYLYYNQWLCDLVILRIVWNVSTIRLLCFPQVTTFDLCLLINSEQITSGHGWLQNSSTRFIKSRGLALADFKNFEVVDLRLRIQESWNVVAYLRIKLKNMQLPTCGCGLSNLKFGCGLADCGLKKKLAVPSTGAQYPVNSKNHKFALQQLILQWLNLMGYFLGSKTITLIIFWLDLYFYEGSKIKYFE